MNLLRAAVISTTLHAAAFAAQAEENFPGIPSAAAIVTAVTTGSPEQREDAIGWLYFLTDAQLSEAEAAAGKQAQSTALATALDLVRLTRGHVPTLDRHATELLREGPPTNALPWDRLTADELAPLAARVAKRLQEIAPKEGGMRRGPWLELAARSHSTELLRLAARLVIERGEAVGRMPAAEFLAAAEPLLAGARTGHRSVVFRCLRPGFAAPPSALIVASAHDPEIAVRCAVAEALGSSSDQAALALVASMMRDRDDSVRNAALTAVISCRPYPVATLREAALSDASDPELRARIWRELADAGVYPRDEARLAGLSKSLPMPVRLAAIDGLARCGDSGWVITNLPNLPAALQQGALVSVCAAHGHVPLADLDRCLAAADGPKAADLVRAVPTGEDAELTAWVIEKLRDRRVDVQLAAEQALVVQSSSQPTGSPPDTYELWRRWYDRFRAPFDPERAAVYAAAAEGAARLEQGILDAQPDWVLLRLAGSRLGVSSSALLALARSAHPEVTELLVDLLDDPQFRASPQQLVEALLIRPASAKAIELLARRLSGPGAASAMAVLVAWRVDAFADRLTRLAVIDGTGFAQLRTGLCGWKQADVAKVVRSVAYSPTASPEAVERAMSILLEIAAAADVKDLTDTMRGQGPAIAGAGAALIQLATNGSRQADEALAGVIGGEPTAAARAVIALEKRSRAAASPLDLREHVLAALRKLVGQQAVPQNLRAQVVALLARSADGPGLEVARQELSTWEAQPLREVCHALVAVHIPQAASYVKAVFAMPQLNATQIEELDQWLKQTARTSGMEMIALRRQRDGLVGPVVAAVKGSVPLSLTAELPAVWTIGAPVVPIAVTLKNISTRPLKLKSKIGARLEFAASNNWPSTVIWPATLAAAQSLDLAPGATLHGTVAVVGPTGFADAVMWDRVRMTITWSDAASSAEFNPVVGAWQPVTLVTPALLAVDQIYSK